MGLDRASIWARLRWFKIQIPFLQRVINFQSFKLRVLIILLFSYWIIQSPGLSQSISSAPQKGLPIVKNYAPGEYGSHRQNWCMAQAANGLLYIANGKGVLQFDGRNWKLIMMPNRGHVRSIAVTKDDLVCVGANNDFGVLKKEENGKLIFESWLDKIDPKKTQFWPYL